MKNRQKALRRSLWVSALAIVLCCAMLVGTTFAWFTDSVSSTGNTIQAGTLDIAATVASVDTTQGTYTIEGVNGGKAFGFGEAADLEAEGTGPIISETLWEPGKTSAKLLTVTNNGNLAAKVKLSFDIAEDSGLTGALWYDFVQIKDGQAVGQFTRRPMSTLNGYADGIELPLGPANEDGSAKDAALPNSVSFILAYGMDEEAGNEYQGKSFAAAVSILATQYTYEADGFGDDQYDKNAQYPWDGFTVTPVIPDSKGNYNIFTGAELAWIAQQVNSGNARTNEMTIVLQQNINLNGKDWTPIGGKNVFSGTFDGNGYTIHNLKASRCDNPNYEDRSIGLIGYAAGVTVRNLKIENCEISGRYAAGAVVGEADGPILFENVEVLSGTVMANQDSGEKAAQVAGGILGIGYGAGSQYDGTIVFRNCTNRADITVNKQHAGGLWGSITYANKAEVTVENCHNYGTITSLSKDNGGYAGGFGGYFAAKSLTVTGSTNNGVVKADKYQGDFVGYSALENGPVNG